MKMVFELKGESPGNLVALFGGERKRQLYYVWLAFVEYFHDLRYRFVA